MGFFLSNPPNKPIIAINSIDIIVAVIRQEVGFICTNREEVASPSTSVTKEEVVGLLGAERSAECLEEPVPVPIFA